MGQDLISGVLSLSLIFLTPSIAPSATQASQTATIAEMRSYAVKEGETISQIAKNEYGSEEMWVNIWNDNPWIQNPDLIEKDWKLKLRADKPKEVAVLKTELEARQNQAVPNVTPIPNVNLASVIETNIPSVPSVTPVAQQPTPIPTAAVTSLPTSSPVLQTSGPLTNDQINFLGRCESGMTATRNSGNGYYGAFQFSPGTWRSMGTAYDRADLAPIEVQIDATQRLLSRSSIYGQFPGCAMKMHASGLL